MYTSNILNCDIDQSIKNIIIKIRKCVDKKIPFALARYGDGEAFILKQKQDEPLNNLTLKIFKKTLGYPNITKQYFNNFQKEWIESIKTMDVNSFQTKTWHNDISKWFYEELLKNKIIINGNNVPIRVTDKLFGHYLLDIIKPDDDIITISCRENIVHYLTIATGAVVRKNILIPSEYEFRKCFSNNSKESQLPNIINNIINIEIPKYVKKGTIVILGVGPPKPIYCNAIKKAGGIALDLGSTIDTICGLITRGKNKGNRNNYVSFKGTWCLCSLSDTEQKNLGDLLGRNIPLKLFPECKKFLQPNNIKENSLICLGSVLNKNDNNNIYLGAGLVRKINNILSTRNIIFVRGPLSSNCFLNRKPLWITDTGILTSLAYPRPIKKPKYDIVVVLHKVDQDIFIKNKNKFKSLGIPVRTNWGYNITELIDFICSGKIVISTSLHGQIIAHSYGIPSIAVNSGDRIIGYDFKYKDYYASLHNGSLENFSFPKCIEPNDFKKAAELAWFPKENIIKKKQELILRIFNSLLKINNYK